MGKKKSSEFFVLLQHLSIQLITFTIFLCPIVGFNEGFTFAFVNALIHGVIDWNIWRLYKLSAHKRILNKVAGSNTPDEDYKEEVANWKYWEDHMFYSTIGLDQLLHTLTIISLYSVFI